MDPTFFQTWVPIALGLINLCGLVWAILQSSAKKNAEAIDNLAKAMVALGEKLTSRIDLVERRTATLEDAYKHLPDKESMHRLEINIERLGGSLGVITADMKAVREISVMTRDLVMNQDVA